MDHVSFETDRERRNRLIQAGWSVLNFTWDYCKQRPDDLCNLVAQTLAAPPTPNQTEILVQ